MKALPLFLLLTFVQMGLCPPWNVWKSVLWSLEESSISCHARVLHGMLWRDLRILFLFSFCSFPQSCPEKAGKLCGNWDPDTQIFYSSFLLRFVLTGSWNQALELGVETRQPSWCSRFSCPEFLFCFWFSTLLVYLGSSGWSLRLLALMWETQVEFSLSKPWLLCSFGKWASRWKNFLFFK